MTRFRNALPQLGGDFFLTDGAIETTLIFHEGLALPDFAAFDLLMSYAIRARSSVLNGTANRSRIRHLHTLTAAYPWHSR